jgi:LuxR family quorum sensing-dependent transcriptional regulator
MSFITTDQLRRFAEVCLHAKRPDQIATPLTGLLRDVGIKHWYVGTLVHESVLDQLGWGYFGMIPGWQEHYAGARFSDTDAVFQHARTQLEDATWLDIRARVEAKSGMRKNKRLAVFEESKQYDLVDGYIQPMRNQGRRPTAVTFGGTEAIKWQEVRATLKLIAAYAHEGFMRYNVGFEQVSPRLSARERDVLLWTAVGKSAWEISKIYSISEATVREYQKSLRRKYRSPSMTRVAVIAALNRTIPELPTMLKAA